MNPPIKRSGIKNGVIIINIVQNIKNNTITTIISQNILNNSLMLYKELMGYLYE